MSEEKEFKKKLEAVEKSQSGYEIKLLDREVKDLKTLKEIITYYFPDLWFETKACLSACLILSLKNMNGCPSLNLVGNPSGGKTTILSFFYGHDKTYISDDFTPKAFVSHATNVKKEELENIDLLPRIRNKILITPELAPLFESSKDKLIDTFAMLTRVLDGEGLHRDTGTQGHRGYSGDYKFVWLGATTPIRSRVWNLMGKLGNRLFFLNMHETNKTEKDYLEMFSGEEYEERVKTCRSAIRDYLNYMFKWNKPRSMKWAENPEDKEILKEIIKYSKLLSKLRGSLVSWKSKEEGKDYEYQFPIIEEPMRAINFLRNLARGHAIINGRRYLTKDDLVLVKRVCLSSMPHDRYMFFQLLQKHKGRLTTEIIQKELSCSDDTARRTMRIFEVLGVVTIKDLPMGEGRPMFYVEINPEFQDLIDTQGVDIVRKTNKTIELGGMSKGHIHPSNDEEKSNTHENTPLHEKVGVTKFK